jgi:hypothetical protein
MGAIRALAAVCSIALVAAIMVAVVDPAFAVERVPGGGGVRGAPGPIVGTGLVTVVIGAGAYWLFRRFRKTR